MRTKTTPSHPDIPPCPDPEFNRLSQHIREWRPDFRTGSRVVRRRGTLGNGPVGTVREFVWRGTHLFAVVEMPYGTETFVASNYERA